MSMNQVLQVIIIVNDALSDLLIEPVDLEKAGACLDILGMLQAALLGQVYGGAYHE